MVTVKMSRWSHREICVCEVCESIRVGQYSTFPTLTGSMAEQLFFIPNGWCTYRELNSREEDSPRTYDTSGFIVSGPRTKKEAEGFGLFDAAWRHRVDILWVLTNRVRYSKVRPQLRSIKPAIHSYI